ncbi:hypothetical protein, partial [Halorubrum tebenquichense]|uniref:hypothetical protein n=1 Tax=Halorubrum tebenquichense TaxID=119434 RepID=UPI001267BC4A
MASSSVAAIDPEEVESFDDWSGDTEYQSGFDEVNMGSSLHLLDILQSGDLELNHLAGGLYGWNHAEQNEDTPKWIYEHGTIIDVSKGSLYPNQNPESLGHYPERSDDDSFDTGGVDLAYTAVKAAIGVLSSNPYVNATLGAESIVSEFVEDSSSSDNVDNTQEYRYRALLKSSAIDSFTPSIAQHRIFSDRLAEVG